MSDSLPTGICASAALLPDGWASHVSLYWDESGTITDCRVGYLDPALRVAVGPLIPGMINLHSHAFQRGMVGRTHGFSAHDDDFWSWRDVMYRYLARLDPEGLFDCAARLYSEMLRSGYTTVCEFHYVHRKANGEAYGDPDAMGKAILDAARQSGIGLTLLPVFYEYAGFGEQAPRTEQLPFVLDLPAYLNMVDRLQSMVAGEPRVQVGYAPHSLRAVSHESLQKILDHRQAHAPKAPVHMHVAEQKAEVESCLAHYGRRPVEWLFGNHFIDRAWCLIHATHVNASETVLMAESGVTVGLCPTTEADLGDGVFPLPSYLSRRGVYGIGSDSNVSVSPFEELRLLEYVQRLRMTKRNIDGNTDSIGAGTRRYLEALEGGEKASGRRVGQLAKNYAADFIELDTDHTLLDGKTPDEQLNATIFSADAGAVRSVFVSGIEQ